MNADELAVFAAAAQTGGINKAAQILHTVQSNVTQRIRALETELGVPLFHRHSRGVTLTPAGAQLLPYAERIANLLHEAKRAATDGPEPGGRLCIGSLETTAALRMPPVLARYAREYPQVDIILQTGTTGSLIQQVLGRQVEGAFVAGPIVHPDLLCETILEEELVVVTAPWIPSAKALVRKAARDPAGLKVIVFRAGCSYRDLFETYLRDAGVNEIRRMELGTLDGIIGCVGAGIGVTMLPRAVVQPAVHDGRVAVHELPLRQTRVPTQFIRRRDGFVSTALSRFVVCAQEVSAQVAAQVPTAGESRARNPRPARVAS